MNSYRLLPYFGKVKTLLVRPLTSSFNDSGNVDLLNTVKGLCKTLTPGRGPPHFVFLLSWAFFLWEVHSNPFDDLVRFGDKELSVLPVFWSDRVSYFIQVQRCLCNKFTPTRGRIGFGPSLEGGITFEWGNGGESVFGKEETPHPLPHPFFFQ